MATDASKQELADLDEDIKKDHGNALKESTVNGGFAEPPDGLFDNDDEVAEPEELEHVAVETDDYTSEAYDEYLMAKFVLPDGGGQLESKPLLTSKNKMVCLVVRRSIKTQCWTVICMRLSMRMDLRRTQQPTSMWRICIPRWTPKDGGIW
jgi:hypothetical protein